MYLFYWLFYYVCLSRKYFKFHIIFLLFLTFFTYFREHKGWSKLSSVNKKILVFNYNGDFRYSYSKRSENSFQAYYVNVVNYSPRTSLNFITTQMALR